jgi:hypothetical protein
MPKDKDHIDTAAQRFTNSTVENMFLALKEVRQVAYLIGGSLSELEKSELLYVSHTEPNLTISDIARLAIDALGGSDPSFLINIYQSGGHIEIDTLNNLGTALIRSRRNGRDSLEIFNELQNRGK